MNPETLVANGYKKVGEFYVGPDCNIVGPAEYLKSEAFRKCSAKIDDGSHCLLAMAPEGTDPLTLLGTIFQTDYAAWLGMRRFMAGMAR